MNLPKSLSDQARSFTVASFSPLWKRSEKFFHLPENEELARLQLENQNLRTQIEAVYEWILSEARIGEQFEFLKELKGEEIRSSDLHWRGFFARRASQLKNRLESQLLSFPAQIIYRDPSSWSSSLWVYAGEEDNRALGQRIIAKNSPVVAGGSLVGIVDFVGEKQSRIRLLTDSGVSPAVRSVRGGAQNRELCQMVQTVMSRLELRGDLFTGEEEKEEIFDGLQTLSLRLGGGSEDGYLAKGEIHGSSTPFWRSRGQILKGVGFNYDYSDEEGQARDLRTGRLLGSASGAIPILKKGDLLVTSGLDGVFPTGLPVGVVAWVDPLKEGAYSYDIGVQPCSSHLSDLQTVFILPSLSSE